MKYWSITPRDGAIFRDARPFTGNAGAYSMPLPWPSTVAGFVRSQIGMSDVGVFELTPAEARSISVTGPWITSPDETGAWVNYFPAPADALFYRSEDATAPMQRYRLSPRPTLPDGALSDLPSGLRMIDYTSPPETNPGKPSAGPAYWSAKAYGDWLLNPANASAVVADDIGISALATDERVHVGIAPTTRTADPGVLFSTERRVFYGRGRNGSPREFSLACRTSDHENADRLTRLGSIGGERLLARTDSVHQSTPLLPCPEAGDARLFRVILLTPAIFSEGNIPVSIGHEHARVVAACVGRYQPVSGWCFEARGPKPSRRMAPAGSVYWVELARDVDASQWIGTVHLTCVSTEAQDSLDGFGLAAVGVA